MSRASRVVTIKRRYVYEDLDRWGNVRLYFWRGKGHRKVRILEPVGSEAFDARYHELVRRAAVGELKPPRRDAPQTGTFRWLCQLYLGSSASRDLDPRTQLVRRQNIDHMCAECIAPGAVKTFGDCPLGAFGPKAVQILRDRKKDTPESANQRVKIVRAVFRWALDPVNEVSGIETNPARDVPFLRPKRVGGFPTWTPDDISQFERRYPLGTKARVAFDLLRCTGVRRSDVIRLGPQHLTDTVLTFTAFKGRNKMPVRVDMEIGPALQASLDAGPVGDMVFLLTEHGKPYSHAGFGNWFARQCALAGLKDRSAHGLRKAAATAAAEEGLTAYQLMARFGWLTLKQAERYTRAADRKRLGLSGSRQLNRSEAEHIFPTSDGQCDVVGKKEAKS